MATTTNATSSASTVAYSYLQSKNKIGGLVSGMDIDSIMEKLMKAESGQMEKLQQQKQKYEWKRDAYREVSTNINTFSENLFDKYGLSSSWNIRSVNNTGAGSVNATANASATGNLTLSNATKSTAANIVAKDPRKTIDITDETYKPYNKTSTIASLGLSSGTFTLKAIGTDGKLSNSAEISYTETDTLETLATKINSSKAGVTALVVDGQFSLTANNTGRATDSTADITVEKATNDLFGKLGFTTEGASAFDLKAGDKTASGSNAKVTVNGIELTSSTNNFSVAGYSLEITNNFTPEINITSKSDTDAAVTKVKEFVASYNELIKSLNDRLVEKKITSYSPLTDAQKAEMNDSEILKWEEKAKSGLLRSDSILRNVVSELRSTVYSTDKDAMPLSKIGITTTSTYTDGGQIQLDEAKLLEALEKDPNILTKVFTGDKGAVSTMRTATKSAIANIKTMAGNESMTSETTYSIGRDISTITDKISDWKERLKTVEDRYWTQFTAMETAINKANSQASIFSS